MLAEGLRITHDITIGIRPLDSQLNIVIEKTPVRIMPEL